MRRKLSLALMREIAELFELTCAVRDAFHLDFLVSAKTEDPDDKIYVVTHLLRYHGLMKSRVVPAVYVV